MRLCLLGSWDRQPYFTDVADASGSLIPLYNNITGNFFMNNYNGQESIDNDDGSAYYETSFNFFPDSVNGLKNDFGGHSNHHHDNLYVQTSGGCMSDGTSQLQGSEDRFYNNKCVLVASTEYAHYSNGTIIHSNEVFTTTGTATENNQDVKVVQAAGGDVGTTVNKLPSNDQIISWARDLLQF